MLSAPHPRHRARARSTTPASRERVRLLPDLAHGELSDGLEVRRALVLRREIRVGGGVALERQSQRRGKDGRQRVWRWNSDMSESEYELNDPPRASLQSKFFANIFTRCTRSR